MDFPVEATVHLNRLGDGHQALDVLRSHGFRVFPQGSHRLRVEGSFFELQAVKAQLEQLAPDQLDQNGLDQDRRAQTGSSGTVSSYYDGGPRSRSLPRQRRVSPAGHCEPDASHHSQQRAPPGPGRETFVIDSDVFKYANRFRKTDMDDALSRHGAFMTVRESGGSSTVSVGGRSPKSAAQNLQSLLHHLEKSLRTQDVPDLEVDRDGYGGALLARIQRDDNGYNSVLVCETNDGLHLIGPPKESFELQQQLMGSAERGRGRSHARGARFRSSSTPETRRERGRHATDGSPPPRGAAGQSTLGIRDAWGSRDARGHGAEPEHTARGVKRLVSLMRPKRSEVRQKPNGVPPKRDDSQQPPTSSSSSFTKWFKDSLGLKKDKKHKK